MPVALRSHGVHVKPASTVRVHLQDSLFGEMYSSGRMPISPVAFLRTWWHTAGGHLEGYQQQDSHEFYLNALSGLVREQYTADQVHPCSWPRMPGFRRTHAACRSINIQAATCCTH